uniref:Brix domain-containing protein n=1 Tax=Panagrolaimus sp. JU765 TaxID=591449 RepID=A0AC34QI89_9BILA
MVRKNRGRARSRRAGLGIPSLMKKKRFNNKTEEDERKEAKAVQVEKRKAREAVHEKELADQPHSMIVHSGKVGRYVKRLEHDFREVLDPNTALNLQVTKQNNFKDFIINAPALGVTHIGCFTKSEKSVNLRLLRSPQGPTVHFNVLQYTLSRDVRRIQKRLLIFEELFKQPPLVILNGFNNPEKKHLLVLKAVLQNMFPVMNIDKVKLAIVRRAVLINYDNESDTMDFRHYSIKTVPSGMTKSTKKIVQGKVPDLSKYEDISEYFLNPGALSESEWEFEQAEVDLPQNLKTRGCSEGGKTKIRMMEIGPRMTWKLTKIQDGMDDGEVLYHAHIKKTEAEIAEIKKRLPSIIKKKKRLEKENEHRMIRKLKEIEEERKAEEAEYEEIKQKLIRKQKAVTGDEEESDPETRNKIEAEKQSKASNSQKNQGLPPERKQKAVGGDVGPERKRKAVGGGVGPERKLKAVGGGVGNRKKNKFQSKKCTFCVRMRDGKAGLYRIGPGPDGHKYCASLISKDDWQIQNCVNSAKKVKISEGHFWL